MELTTLETQNNQTPPPIGPLPTKNLWLPSLTFLLLIFASLAVLAWKTPYLDGYLSTEMKNFFGKSQENTSQNATQSILAELKTRVELQGFAVTGPKAGEMWWSEGAEERFVLNRFADVLTVENSITKEESKIYNERSYQYPKIQKLYETSRKFFAEKGFTSNVLNSLKPSEDRSWLNYVEAFESALVFCTASVSNGSFIFDYGTSQEREAIVFDLACEDDFNQAKAEQIPYLEGLDLDSQAGINVEKKVGDFFSIGVWKRVGIGGHYMIGKWEGSNLIEIFSGQDIPPCTKMEQYFVPQEVYGDCYPTE